MLARPASTRFFAFAIALLSLCMVASAQQFPASQDTCVSTNTANAGDLHGLTLVVDTNDQALFYFELSPLPSSVTARQTVCTR